MAKIITFLCVALISISALVLRVDAQDKIVEIEELSPVQQSEVAGEAGAAEAGDGKERDKRFFVIKKIGLKAGLVDLVFGKIDSFIDSKTRYINELDKQNIVKNQKYFGITFPPPTTANPLNVSSTTPAIEFEVNAPVNLVIDSRLFGSTFGLLTNASEIVSNLLFNTAGRAKELSDAVSGKLKAKAEFVKKVSDIKNAFTGKAKYYG